LKDANATITKLENAAKPDPVRGWLQFAGILGIVAGVAVVVGSYFVPFLSKLEGLGAGVLVASIFLVAIAHFLTALYWIAGACGVAFLSGGAVWLFVHLKLITAPKPIAAPTPPKPLAPPRVVPTPTPQSVIAAATNPQVNP